MSRLSISARFASNTPLSRVRGTSRGSSQQTAILPNGKGKIVLSQVGTVKKRDAAKATGQIGYPICPVAFAASRFFTVPTWDKTILPLPFGRIAVCCEEPLEVPRTRDKGVLEAKRAEIERRLIHANEEAQYHLKNTAGK